MITAAVFGVVKNGRADINERYYEHIRQSGVVPVDAYPLKPAEVVKRFDCLVVCGGGDMHPKFYSQKPYTDGLLFDVWNDRYELSLINMFLSEGKPILGICRGMQSINIALGGTLIQDIPSMLGLCHSDCGGHECEHEIKISKISRLSGVMGLRAVVNSYHHQCIHAPGDGLFAAAASHDGVIEAIESIDRPVLGVQWHPERMSGNAVFDLFFNTYLQIKAPR